MPACPAADFWGVSLPTEAPASEGASLAFFPPLPSPHCASSLLYPGSALKNHNVNTICPFNLVSIALLSAFVKFCILILFVVVSSFLLLFFFGYKAIRVRED